jgi:sugar phosphate isomerase/epimerase
MELALAWGASNGLGFGTLPAALDDLLAWIDATAAAGIGLLRVVAAGPAFRGREPVEAQIARTVAPLAEAAARAAEGGVFLAVENHGDLAAAELADLLERVGDARLGVCLDTANLLRLGDDVLAGTRLLAPRTLMVHLKDVEPLATAIDHVSGPASVCHGTGVVPLEGVLATLGEAGFAGPVCVEVAQLRPGADERELVRAGVSWLRAWEARPRTGTAAPGGVDSRDG